MVFYFSGTGNTRWAARQLAAATQEQTVSMAEALLNDNCNFTLADGERIGFCFPVHGWQPPHIVRKFMAKLNFNTTANHFCYALCTCGDSAGLAMEMFSHLAALRGVHVESTLSLLMPESYVCLPFMYTDTPQREQQKKAQASTDLTEFCHIVTARRAGFQRIVKGPVPWLLSHVVGAFFNRFMINDSKFRADGNTCIRCGRCVKECPVADIQMADVPRWKGNGQCTCCLSCYHHCPVHAINYGRITRKRGQYYYDMKHERR